MSNVIGLSDEMNCILGVFMIFKKNPCYSHKLMWFDQLIDYKYILKKILKWYIGNLGVEKV